LTNQEFDGSRSQIARQRPVESGSRIHNILTRFP